MYEFRASASTRKTQSHQSFARSAPRNTGLAVCCTARLAAHTRRVVRAPAGRARAAMASGVQIEHKKGEVNELKASLRNPSLDRVCCCSSARHSSFGGAGARVEVTRSLRRASKIGVLT